MVRLHKSMTSYVKSLSKRNEAEDKEKTLPVGYMGQTMINHGEDFEPDSEFGNCLISMGRANERIARIQETYVVNATNGWLESLERSLAMMKEYQAARKKLENRRLAYDASLSKMQKAKKEDFRVEEELRSQKAKYEESSEDVVRRMQDIKEAEAESVSDLGAFVDAELEYYDRCRDELLRMKRDWPAGQTSSPGRDNRRPAPRSRANTAHDYAERYSAYDEPPVPEEPVRPSIRSQGRVASTSKLNTQMNSPDEYTEYDYPAPRSPRRPTATRSSTFQGPTSIYRELTPVSDSRKHQVPHDVGNLRATLRPSNRVNTGGDLFGDPSDDSTMNSASPDRSYGERSGPPPPPPSRAKKAPPPPPKRADMSSTSVNKYY
ncbi:putative Meiotically up-regulated gene protein [Glarea lozoyensis 74030]|uniref:Putative Meiotically up-regulated gene protein n=1 Tax=Glarea lozoyensis (strain ATCC 74030 / MF5533) TaxID=1104152 RepID=H0ETR9_GLAL7|nr:putative Meiotically up-regulated gene protein [Glarea lozoyensis 74030]